MKPFLAGLAKSLIATIIFFMVFEMALRGAYFARNAQKSFANLSSDSVAAEAFTNSTVTSRASAQRFFIGN